MVKPKDYNRLMAFEARQIFAAIVALYGEKLANDLAADLLSGKDLPTVTWPRF
ncbi:hypothetical protein [Rhizobium rhizogenes]|uniref:Uncharacterized protein n=1 Tax=Rhizobium rhizogenes (strain K84 / ATCC BAA-868) TaxID=311403 RepID=B9JF32_RHIR8|nr:hypothetical protein Arad_2300 [Rhizobium rhizogenes K84]